MTSLPPPPAFAGYESTDYGDDGYERECTPDEVDLFNAFYAAVEAEERAEDEAFRDGWLARIRESLEPGEKFAAG